MTDSQPSIGDSATGLTTGQLTVKLAEFEKRIDEKFKLLALAIEIAAVASEKRFDSVNEFRGQLADQATRFTLREVSDKQYESVDRRLKRSEDLQAKALGAIGVVALVGVANFVKFWTG